MPLHISFGLVRWAVDSACKSAAWFRDKLARLFMLPTYRRSHAVWVKRSCLGANWKPLWAGVEYDISVPHPAYPEPRICRVAFRAPETPVRSAEMILEVRGAGIRYQEHIRLHDINSRPIVLSLRSVPELDVELTGDNIFFSVDEYVFLSGTVVLSDGTERKYDTSLLHSLIQNWLFNDEWVTRWGRWWNCNEVMNAKRLIAEYWRFRFGYGTTRSRVLGNTLGTSWAVSVQFWLAVSSRLFVLSDDGELILRWREIPAK
ncbi:hypothetical protein [Burkholderia multivorans]|uniref:hypothetical protein n=1 Tax=Burkholderia multivorans TaxID=87883 RepID=UPI000ADB32A2|nr:hypothetical protein [Burkholderia multivorans]